MQKDHLEILLEEMNGKFTLVLEGHEALRNEIREARDESNTKHEHTAFMLDTLNKKIDNVNASLSARIDTVSARIDDVEARLSEKLDAVAADLSAHRADTEAHHGIYCVKES